MSIAEQIATPDRAAPTRRRSTAFHPAPSSRTVYALLRLGALVAITALGVAFIVGTVAIAIMMLASSLGG